MTRILRSIAIRFPLLLAAIVIAVAVVTGQLANREIGQVLVGAARHDLEDGVTQLAQMLGDGLQTARRNLTEAASAEGLRRAFATQASEADAQRLLERYATTTPGPTRAAARLLAPDGTVRATWTRVPGATSMGWTIGSLRDGVLPRDSASIGPLVAISDTMPGFVAVAPVRAADGTQLGWLEEVHVARGTGVAEIRKLIDIDRLLIGSTSWTVWSDFDRIVAGPEFTAAPDSVQRVVSPGGTPALGLARPVAGTPWLVWVERPEAEVMAPIDQFLERMWLATLVIAVVGAGFAWLLAHYFASRIRAVAGELDRTLTAHGSSDVTEDRPPVRDPADELRQLEESYAALEQRVEERRRLDEQVLQAQKLEAVGRLAGGIAHDFNNLLTVMASYGGMARESLPPGSPEAKDLDEVLKAIDRATALTRHLLTFSRQRLSDVRPLDVNVVVRSTDSMLVRLIPSNVERSIELTEALPFVIADHIQLEQVLVNLVVNAVDAMPEGGRLTVRTTRERVSGLRGGDASGPEEDCVCLAVSDTGVGMDAATMARVFDPFFTTKPLGKGTGLGLATVHGIVQSAGGRVVAYSEPGQGTTMRVYLPVARAHNGNAEPPSRPVSPRSVQAITAEHLVPGLVLLAEDDPSTRTVIRRILETRGHRVEARETADACLEWLTNCPDDALPLAVISDVMMPGMNGIAFAAVLRERYPQLPVILVSGYADVRDRVPDDLAIRPVILEKPFTASALHDALRRAVQGAVSGGEA
ncbi:MAG: hypothetical protein C0503_04425 [Gemmatimonas sp.]|nr:hypothetical protein [Gemmatimonas sp.]